MQVDSIFEIYSLGNRGYEKDLGKNQTLKLAVKSELG